MSRALDLRRMPNAIFTTVIYARTAYNGPETRLVTSIDSVRGFALGGFQPLKMRAYE